jgi:hypothetical protein
MHDIVDFSRPPTGKERLKFAARLDRLGRPETATRMEKMQSSMPGALPADGLILRSGFSYREKGVDTEASDRKAPPHSLRPTATRLITSRGAALRFALTALAVVQSNRKPGAKAHLHDFGLDLVGSSGRLGWTDLIATTATDTNLTGVFLMARDKRARSVRSAILALAGAGIAFIPGGPGDRDRFEKFALLNEIGRETIGEAEEYCVPRKDEPTFTVPSGFVSNGWLHLLEDSEIALLFMVACRKGGWDENGLLAIPAEVRLRHYGIHRDAYSSARKSLEWFGLLKVEEVGRHEDGRAENAELRVNRLALLRDGFGEPATSTMIGALSSQIARN